MRAVPEGTDRPRHEQLGWTLPDLPPGAELFIEALDTLGYADQTGMSLTPLMFTEIAHGAPWASHQDRLLIRKMSRAYCVGVNLTSPFSMSPMEKE